MINLTVHLCQCHVTILSVTENSLFTCQKSIRIVEYLLHSSPAPTQRESCFVKPTVLLIQVFKAFHGKEIVTYFLLLVFKCYLYY